MINDKVKFKVGKIQVDVNWSPEVIPCKKIRFTFDGQEQILDRDDVYSMLMLFGDEKQQDALIPSKKREMVLIERMLHIKAGKDIAKGEMITVPYQYSMDVETYEDMVKKDPRQFRRITTKEDGLRKEKEI
jgi:hypothetical protein